MAELLKRELPLLVLRISLHRAGSDRRASAVFTLDLGQERLDEPATVDCDELGLPARLEEIARAYRYGEPDVHLPDALVDRLRHTIAARLPPGDPLWLELANPIGNLAVVPWERLLQPRVGVPILRLPQFATQPTPIDAALDVVICASSPIAKEPIPLPDLLAALTTRIRDGLAGRDVALHIFADARLYDAFGDPAADSVEAPWGPARLYNPRAASGYAAPERSPNVDEPAGQMDNPWLRWIATALAGRGVDIVHFLCHGYLSMEQGAIALAASPMGEDDPRWARFVGPRQIDAFLTRIGAWSVGFSSPPMDFSRAGLRLLLDQIGRVRPGPQFLHVEEQDPGGAALVQTYRFLYNGHGFGVAALGAPPATPAVSVCAYPGHVHEEWSGGPRGFVGGRDPGAMPRPSPQTRSARSTWVAAGTRSLEKTYARALEPEPVVAGRQVVQDGVADALAYLTDAIERHAAAQEAASEEGRS